MSKRCKKILIICSLVLLIAAVLYLIYYFVFNPRRELVKNLVESPVLETVVTEKEAREDIDYLIHCLRQYHPAYADHEEEWIAAVEAKYNEVTSQISGDMTVLDVWKAASLIISATYTTHCGVYPNRNSDYISSLVEVNQYELVSINGVSYDELYDKYLSYASYEKGCEGYVEVTFINNLIAEVYLQLLGFDTEKGVDFTFLVDGVEQTFHYDFVPYDQVMLYSEAEDESGNEPGISTDVYYDIDEENSIGILTIKNCTYDDYYKSQLNAFFAEIEANGIESVIVDLRNNPGGSSNVAEEFIEHLAIDSYQMFGEREVRYGPYMWRTQIKETKVEQKEDAFSGDVYVLMSSLSCSASVDFAAAIQDNGLGVIVGDIPGNKPTCYTNMKGVYQMKNTKLRFYIPTTISHRADVTKDKEPLYPDYEIDSYRAMDKAYELITNE